MKDLRSQVTTLTVQVETLRHGAKRSYSSAFGAESDLAESSEIVTFKNVEELQTRNEQLLCRMRAVEAELATVKKETNDKIAAQMKVR
jgi:hypothetical protein